VTAPTLVGPLLQIFFTDHLVAQRNGVSVSRPLEVIAIHSRLLLQFVHRETGIEPAVLAVPRLDAEIILRVNWRNIPITLKISLERRRDGANL
jgi:hypothetical protein